MGRGPVELNVAYSLEQYKQRTDRLRWDDLDLGVFADRPLDPDALRCLRFMHDVEYHTVCYLRDLLLTPAHNDPEITAFLSFWAFEEFWHGEAHAAVLAAHGEAHGAERVVAVRDTLGWRDKIRPLLTTVGGWWAKEDFTAVHMTWGAINEWTTQAGYSLLARKAAHPVFT
ncbi:MAG: ferritin-like domain-containing protein, partial [Acidimicrobiales bacterium]